MDSVTARLLKYQRDNNLINPESQSTSYFSKIERTDDELNELTVEENMAEMIDSYLQDVKN